MDREKRFLYAAAFAVLALASILTIIIAEQMPQRPPDAAPQNDPPTAIETQPPKLDDAADEFSAYIASSSARIQAFTHSKHLVREQLKAPSTADFPGYDESFVQHQGGGLFHVTAFVDAQNSFGAMIRGRYSCILEAKAKDDWRGICGLEGK